MPFRHKNLTLRTTAKNQILDITEEVRTCVREAGAESGVCTVYTPHATAAITINENADPNVGTDFLRALAMAVPEHEDWLHDRVDDNAAAHIKSALVGPSETIPIQDGKLALGTWQNVFFCEFDGPRSTRRVIVSVSS
ncbi:MAG: secondary thiamine-phosphate synthase enzyme YjbQ [Thermoanaerobaculia bacterium]|nr:secondary thiamine-phosphate synthase enzyme YjbQ [Thermoanaerobaculia bacterium]